MSAKPMIVTAPSLALVPAETPLPEEQQQYFTAMIDAAKIAGRVGYGAHGSFLGVLEGVKANQLWVHPDFTGGRFTDAELAACAESLRVVGQQTPIRCVQIRDPGNPDRACDLMILDFDGALVYEASGMTGIKTFKVLVEEFAGSLHDLMLQALGKKFQQHTLTYGEVGRWVSGAKESHQQENAQRTRARLPRLKEFPSNVEMGRVCGKSADWIEDCVRVAKGHPDVEAALDAGIVSLFKVRDTILKLPRDEQPAALEQLLQEPAPLERQAKPMLSLTPDRRKTAPIQWADYITAVPAKLLLLPDNRAGEIPAPVILGTSLYNIRTAIETQVIPQDHPIVKQLLRICEHPDVVQLIEAVLDQATAPQVD